MSRHLTCLANILLVFAFAQLAPCAVVAATSQSRTANKEAIASPRDVLGFNPGDDRKVADWNQISNYFRQLAVTSNRVRLRSLGQTTLGRDLFVAFISAPENIAALNRYSEIQRKLADPRLIKSDGEKAFLLQNGKVVVAISCSIHSTEIVASQMSMQLAYNLASAQDSATREILKNTILILIPSSNPDGVDIVARWYRRTLGTRSEGKDPPELYHYYAGHDDNRDWFMLDLKETRLITRLFWKEWFPEIVYDVHQQGQTSSRMFIPPFYDPPNPRIDPVLLRQVGLIGSKMAADLQSAGFKGVITNALYDTWWHGGFRTAPYFHNSIGILTEAASAGIMSPVTITPDQLARSFTRGMPSALQAATNFPDPWQGGLWRPKDILNMELVTSNSLLSLVSHYRDAYLRDFYELGRKSLETPDPSREPIAYLIPAGQGNEVNIARFIDSLVSQGIEVSRLDRELHVRFDGSKDFVEAPASSYLVFAAQPYKRDVQSLFEKQVYPDRRGQGGEAERPYDVTGWTLPLQMGIETNPIREIEEKATKRTLTLISDPDQVRKDLGILDTTTPAKDTTPLSFRNPLHSTGRIGIYKGWTANMDEGWTRFVFDSFNIPFQSIDDLTMRVGSLTEEYNTVILPSMRMRDITNGNSPDSYPIEFANGIGASGISNLKEFVSDGGTLICFDASCELPIKSFDLPVKNVLEGLKTSEFYCPGSILAVNLESNTAREMRMPKLISAYFINSSAFEVTDTKLVRVLATYAENNVLQSGWLLGEKYLAGKAAIVDVPFGRGHITMFAFRPQHRAQTWGTFPLIWNAIDGFPKGS